MQWVVLTRLNDDGSESGEVYVNLDEVVTLTAWHPKGTYLGLEGDAFIVKEAPLQILQARRVVE